MFVSNYNKYGYTLSNIKAPSFQETKPMAAVAKRQTGEVFCATPPRDRQFRTFSPRTKYGYTLSLRITHYEDDEYMVEGIDGWSGILSTAEFVRITITSCYYTN